MRKYSLAPVERMLSGEGWVCFLPKGWMDISQPKRLKRESQASRRQLNQQSQMERKMFEGRLRTSKWFHSISLFLIWFIRHFLWCCAIMLLCCMSAFFCLWLPPATLSYWAASLLLLSLLPFQSVWRLLFSCFDISIQ